ncbi:hypothetical protein D3C75_1329420 [compost metagenome]
MVLADAIEQIGPLISRHGGNQRHQRGPGQGFGQLNLARDREIAKHFGTLAQGQEVE